MHNTHLSGRIELSETRVLRPKTTAESASILISIIDIKVAKTVTSFLVDWDKYWHHDHFYYSYNM